MNPHKQLQQSIRSALLPYGEEIKGYLAGSPDYLAVITKANHHIKNIFNEIHHTIGPVWNSGQQVVGVHVEQDLSYTLVYKIN